MEVLVMPNNKVRTLILYANRDSLQPRKFQGTIDIIVQEVTAWLWKDPQVRGDGLTLGNPDNQGHTVQLAYDGELNLGERWSLTEVLDTGGLGGTTIEHGWYVDVLRLFKQHIRNYLEGGFDE
jgi:hypothetical protein